jgi:N-formylglutamate deformylase
MRQPFPIIKRPPAAQRQPILVSIPHYGTHPLPHITHDDYCEPWFATFPYGFADTFVGDLYANLHEQGATILATPFSRIFVDVNRQRDDFEHDNGIVRSHRGVVRTHTLRNMPIFTQPLTPAALEERLRAFYDPYYEALERLLDQLHATYGYVLLLDGHTGSPRRMKDYQVIFGTRHGTTSHEALVAHLEMVFAAHGFEVSHNISGYSGGNIIRTYGHPQTQHVHAIQLEINAMLLMTTSRQEFIAQVSRGEMPGKNEANIARFRACLQEAIETLPAVLAALHTQAQGPLALESWQREM